MTIHCRTSMVPAAGNLEWLCAVAAVTKAIAKTTIRRNPNQQRITSTPKNGWRAQRDGLKLCQPGTAEFAQEQARSLIWQKFAMCIVENRRGTGTVRPRA